ncbi:MAG TPA: 2-oxo-4-hydroxy-4-carboxy-5-ureidoimidazoline decarboxylase [Pirellulales bacterium]|jgi:2-oxo-4-hydroxy-4-carboxy-5-ureidoimidazoline decarboxylase
MAIAEILNRLDDQLLPAALTKCCASRRWVETMAAARPFADDEAVLQTAATIWNRLPSADWREAFAAHPKIGDLESLRAKFGNTRDWASGEQSGVASAAENTIQRLAELNRDYEAKFGYIFIVCAIGKTAEEMLAILQQRLPNDLEHELAIAATEQLKITLLRLQKLSS